MLCAELFSYIIMRDRKIYIVFYGDYEHVQDIEAAFDSMEEVEAFRKRFARNGVLKVMELPLNPKFISDKNRNPYLVSFDKKYKKPIEVTGLFSIDDCELAIKETIKKEGDLISIYLFAKNKAEAIRVARVKCDT